MREQSKKHVFLVKLDNKYDKIIFGKEFAV